MRLSFVIFLFFFFALPPSLPAFNNGLTVSRPQQPDSSANSGLPLTKLIVPKNNLFPAPRHLLFVWEGDTSAAGFRIQISTDSVFANLLIDDTTSQNSYRPKEAFAYGTTYYWRVRTDAGQNTGPWSEMWHLTTIQAGPRLLNPSNNKTHIPLNSGLEWQTLNNAEVYEVQIAGDAQFNSLIKQDLFYESFAEGGLPLQIARRYYWRVRAKLNGHWSDWSPVGTFTTEEPSDGWFAVPDVMFTSPQRVFFRDAYRGWIATLDGRIYRSPDGGISWEVQLSDSSLSFRDLYFWGDSIGWVVGDEGRLFRTENGGADWKPAATGTENNLYAVYFADRLNGWAVGDYGTILLTKDGGSSWQKLPALSDYRFEALSFCCADTGWIVGRYFNGSLVVPVLLKTTNGGQTWTIRQLEYSSLFRDIYFTDRRRGWLAGENGLILYTEDGGTSWHEQAVDSEINFNSLCFIDAQNGWAAGTAGSLYRTSDGGQNWIKEEIPVSETLLSVTFFKGSPGWVITQSGQLIKTNNGATPTPARDLASKIIVTDFELFQNYPNPFNPTTAIGYRLSAISDVELAVYNMLGQKVRTLVKARQAAGAYQVTFDAGGLPSGVYFYRLQVNNNSLIRKMMLIK